MPRWTEAWDEDTTVVPVGHHWRRPENTVWAVIFWRDFVIHQAILVFFWPVAHSRSRSDLGRLQMLFISDFQLLGVSPVVCGTGQRHSVAPARELEEKSCGPFPSYPLLPLTTNNGTKSTAPWRERTWCCRELQPELNWHRGPGGKPSSKSSGGICSDGWNSSFLVVSTAVSPGKPVKMMDLPALSGSFSEPWTRWEWGMAVKGRQLARLKIRKMIDDCYRLMDGSCCWPTWCIICTVYSHLHPSVGLESQIWADSSLPYALGGGFFTLMGYIASSLKG